jgi:ectoine hydroxylase
MRLSADEIARFERDGFLIFEEMFSAAEVAVLRAEAARVAQVEADAVFREGDAGLPKSMFALHERAGPTASKAYRAAAHCPRVLDPIRQVLADEAVYLHHSKVNMKAAIDGTAWPWHQDFHTWHLVGIAAPTMATFMIMLDESSGFNGCLYFVPGSHVIGRTDPYYDDSTAYKLWAAKPDDMKRIMADHPAPVAITGAPGTAALFHCNLLHASGSNLSAHDRWQLYFCFNTVANRPKDVPKPRPTYVRSTDWAAMETGPDEVILAAA